MKRFFLLIAIINLLLANTINKIDKSIAAQQDYLSNYYQELKDYLVLKNFLKINNLIFNYYKKNNFNTKTNQDVFLLSNVKYIIYKFDNPYLLKSLRENIKNTKNKIFNKKDIKDVKNVVIEDIPSYLENIQLYKQLLKTRNINLLKKIYKQASNYFSTNFTYINTNEQIHIFYLINQDNLTKIIIKEEKKKN